MAEKRTHIYLERMIKAPIEEVYQAFTNATMLRLWLCDVASVVPKVGGRVYLWWNSGYFATGDFTQLIEGKQIQFNYHGRQDPGATTVEVRFSENGNSTRLTLTHRGMKAGIRWANPVEVIRRGWEKGLDNLVSVLETGEDQRIVQRPMLGITFAEFDASLASVLNVPVKLGLRVEGTVEGMGARAAGLLKNDVIVEMAGIPVTDYPSLVNIIQKFQAGDLVDIGIYRGGEQLHLSMLLSRRPLPEIPDSAQGLAEALKRNYAPYHELDQLLEDVSEKKASLRPAPNEWSVNEILAHLIITERDTHNFINEVVYSQIRHADGYADNLEARIQAVLLGYPTKKALLDGVHEITKETEDIFARLPEKFTHKKALFWYLAYNFLQPNYHIDDHLKQINSTLAVINK